MVHTIFVLRMPFNSRVIMSKSTKVLRSVYVSCVTAGGLMAGGSYSGAHSFTRRSFSIVMVAASIDMRFLRAMSRSPRGRVSDSEGSAKTPPLCEGMEGGYEGRLRKTGTPIQANVGDQCKRDAINGVVYYHRRVA